MENNYANIIFILSAILIIGGFLMFFAPKFLIKISEPLNKEFGVKRKSKTLILPDEKVFRNRHFFGPILFIIGLILLYLSYSLL